MDYSSEYDRFISRIYRLNMTLLITSILIIGCSLLALFYFIELNFRIITILSLMVLLGLNYTMIKNKRAPMLMPKMGNKLSNMCLF